VDDGVAVGVVVPTAVAVGIKGTVEVIVDWGKGEDTAVGVAVAGTTVGVELASFTIANPLGNLVGDFFESNAVGSVAGIWRQASNMGISKRNKINRGK
jgi:hypothetical protein